MLICSPYAVYASYYYHGRFSLQGLDRNHFSGSCGSCGSCGSRGSRGSRGTWHEMIRGVTYRNTCRQNRQKVYKGKRQGTEFI